MFEHPWHRPYFFPAPYRLTTAPDSGYTLASFLMGIYLGITRTNIPRLAVPPSPPL